MKTEPEFSIGRNGERLTELRNKTVELERELDDARLLLKSELEHGYIGATFHHDHAMSRESRREALINLGRHNSAGRKLSRLHVIAIAGAAVGALIAVLVIILSGSGASWPASVTTVQNEISKACQNPDVKSEPGQVDFACAQGTRQILWVFALMTSGDKPDYNDAASGRIGLEPIAPAQGGQLAWSLNLHHPYNPFNPIDSLQVAARAINSIIGGATVTATNGGSVVQPGLEGTAANCLRYTGSATLTSHSGFPSMCARPLSGVAGQGALVADVYQKWMVGATPRQAQDAAILYENANDPGDPAVQAILRHLPGIKQ
ncbi:MAG TPA: hypothetical protein VMC03_12095 [Streptosporangiaceae bacterium]|nr:hypothetical protein [Streptosporangiaceae bacterium]